MRCHEQGPCQSCLQDEDGDGIPDVVQGDIAANVTNMVGDMVNDMAGGGGGSGEKGGGGMGGVPTGLMQLAGGAGGIAVRYPWPFLLVLPHPSPLGMSLSDLEPTEDLCHTTNPSFITSSPSLPSSVTRTGARNAIGIV